MYFIVDIDRTLTDDYSLFRGVKENILPQLTLEEYHNENYRLEGLVGPGEVKKWLSNFEDGMRMFHSHDQIRPDAVEVINFVRNHGVKVIIITHRRPHFEQITIDFLKNNNISYDNIIFTKGLKSKEVENLIKKSSYIAIDDAPDVLDDYSKHNSCSKVIMMKTNFNNWYENPKCTKVGDWTEVKDILRQLINN